jgi:hypothetical protein
MSDRISVEQQRALQLRRVQNPNARNYVPAHPEPVKLEILPPYEARLDVAHTAKQEVIVSTSAVDRAKGYQIVLAPLSIALGLLAVLVSVLFENQLFSFASLMIFWLTFVICWLVGWIITALATPEAVSFYSAKRQWDVIEREQLERWEHYKWQTGRSDPAPNAPEWWQRYSSLIIVAAIVWTVLAAIVILEL